MKTRDKHTMINSTIIASCDDSLVSLLNAGVKLRRRMLADRLDIVLIRPHDIDSPMPFSTVNSTAKAKLT